MRHLTEPLNTTDFAINYYELESDDSFAFAYHCHEVREEIFYIQSGTATFETEPGDVNVDAGEIIQTSLSRRSMRASSGSVSISTTPSSISCRNILPNAG
jgi:mannose-6-phosphate isomerase-like protein (cupin superfamily)